MTVCSNGSVEYVEDILTRGLIRDLFADIISSSRYETKSAAVSEYLYCHTDIDAICFVGDSHIDFQAADENGIDFIWASYGYAKGRIIGCRGTIASISELVQLLDNFYG